MNNKFKLLVNNIIKLQLPYNEKQNLHIEYVKTMNNSICLQAFLVIKLLFLNIIKYDRKNNLCKLNIKAMKVFKINKVPINLTFFEK